MNIDDINFHIFTADDFQLRPRDQISKWSTTVTTRQTPRDQTSRWSTTVTTRQRQRDQIFRWSVATPSNGRGQRESV